MRRAIPLLLMIIASVAAVPLLSAEAVGGELPELATLTVGGEYDAATVDATLSEAAARLAGEGFFDARLTPELRRSEGGYRLLVRVETGTRYSLGELTIVGVASLPATTVEAAARAAWRQNGVNGLTSAVEELYVTAGYLAVELEVGRLKLREGTASLTLAVVEGEPSLVGEVAVAGVAGTAAERTARLALGLVPGEPLTASVIEAARKRLAKSGYYRSAELLVEEGGDEGRIPLRLVLQPARSFLLDGVVGLLPGEELRLHGEVRLNWRNIGGGGHDLDLSYRQLTRENGDYHLSLTERYLFGSSASLEAAYDGLRRPERASDRGSLRLTQPLTDQLDLSLGGRLSWDVQPTGDSFLLAAELGLTLDLTDEPFLPTRGVRLWTLLIAGQRRFTDYSVAPLTAQVGAEGFWTPFQPHTVQLALSAGLAEAEDPADSFYLGGAARPRGYRSEELPTNSYAQGTLEYRLRLGNSGYLLIFGDGAGYLPLTSTLSRQLRDEPELTWAVGYGGGIFVRTGLGGLEVVYAMNKDGGLGEGFLQARLVLDGLF
ncbi:BamA/TamA family outer membrane protein [bacterium]|nr:BamA/TamA family outer membrane protein [bacterium]